jgi:Uma2 family endonuclease
MALTSWRHPPLTPEEADDLFMLLLEDDEEDSPWMVMGDLQFWSASGFAHSLRNYAREQGLAWYVASMLPIRYEWPNSSSKKQLSPDTFVSFVQDRIRTSYDLEEEGMFPPFVLEVVSPSSTARDQGDKRRAYDLLGVSEYALFTPRENAPSTLEGYLRDESGQLVRWEPDADGRLWSAVLGLYLVIQGANVQAQTPDGRLLLTPEQAEAARRRAERAQHDAEAARQRAEEEAERLRRELERYRDSGR